MDKLSMGFSLMLVTIGLVVAQDIEKIPPPTVHEDGRVTFRRLAPDANKVALSLESKQKPIRLTKGADGVWSVTTESLPPDIYAYHFLIDGVPADDPTNDNKLPVITGGSQGLVHIPGGEDAGLGAGRRANGNDRIS